MCQCVQACTPEGGDEYSTGSLVPCCAGLSVYNVAGKLICSAHKPEVKCTPYGGDEYATGSLVPCCPGLAAKNEAGKLICRPSMKRFCCLSHCEGVLGNYDYYYELSCPSIRTGVRLMSKRIDPNHAIVVRFSVRGLIAWPICLWYLHT